MIEVAKSCQPLTSSETLIVGNVRKHSGSKRVNVLESGKLIFNANFESGNLGRVDALSPNEYDLFIRPDTCNPKYRVWFYFSVENAKANQRVLLNIVNFSKIRCLFDSGSATPVFRTNGAQEWSRIPAKHIYYYRSQPHGNRLILSFVHVFQSKGERCEFAYCVPYTYSNLQAFLSKIERLRLDCFQREMLTLSVQKRQVDLLTISSAEYLRSPEPHKYVFLMGRVHPGETPSSIVLQGFIEFLLSDDDRAVRLRSLFVFKIVPMLNPDGVYLGNYRCSLMGFDLNRQWQNPSAWAHPSIAATKSLLLQYDKDPAVQLCLCIDLHAHSQQTNSFLYGNFAAASSSEIREQQLYLPFLLADFTNDYSLQYTQFNTDAEKAGTNRRAMGEILSEECLCYTLEVSFFSYRHKDNPAARPIAYLESSYQLLGENLARAILDFAEVVAGSRRIEIQRPFKTFLSKRKDVKKHPPKIRQTQSSGP